MFLNVRGRRSAPQQGTSHAWPYQEIETINVRAKKEYRDMVDVYKIFNSGHEAFNHTREKLDSLSKESIGESSNLAKDISWRANFFGKTYDYWDVAAAGMPNELTRSVTRQKPHPGPVACPEPAVMGNNFLALWNEKFYENCQLVRDRFRCFHRSDG